MVYGFRGRGAAGRVFDAPSCALHRSIETDGHERLGQRRSPGGKGREAEFPAQAQVAAWARGCAGARGWAAAAEPGALARARVCWLGRNGLMNRNSSEFFFYFSRNIYF